MPDLLLSARPDGSVTYNATVFNNDGTNSEVAKVQRRKVREEGTIILSNPPKTYNVKHSMKSGIWNLVLDDPHAENDPMIVATKPKWYRDTIHLEVGGEKYEFVRPSIRKRDYIVGRVPKDHAEGSVNDHDGDKKKKIYELSGPQIGELRTDGNFKRTYSIRFDDGIPVELPLFCYWLVGMLNKRANSQYNSGAGAPPP